MALLDDIRSHLAVANEDQRKRRGAVLLREAAAEIERLRAITPSESDSPQAIASTPSETSTPGEGTRQAEGIVTRLRQTRANMLGTDDEDHYWDCHDAAGEIERLRLTDAEREAIEVCIQDIRFEDVQATLRGLLERTSDRT
jgi:hypothetical protein